MSRTDQKVLIDNEWVAAWELASLSKCSFPGEVAGTAVRLKASRNSAVEALAACSACCHLCTARR